MRKVVALGLAALMVVVTPAGSLAAGALPGTISGVARDTSGIALINAGVRVRSASGGDVVSVGRTGLGGMFSASGLLPGTYVVEALGDTGHVIGVSSVVTVTAGNTAAVMVTTAAQSTQAAQVRSQAGFSLFGLGTGASVGVLAAIAAAAITTVAVVATDDDDDPSPSQ